MSTISTGVGLISGIPIQELVDSLIAVQRRPIDQLSTRLQNLGSRRTAYLQVTSQLLAVQNIATRLANAEFFRRSGATSSNESSIVATAGAGAAVGTYTFSVRSLATTHQLISAGFASADSTPVGAGTLTIETEAALVNRSTSLDLLNGGQGVRRGRVRITDRAGGSAEIDVTTASTVRDVVRLINGQTTAQVTARVEGDRLVLADATGLSTGSLSVAEVGSGRAAADLGILGSSTTGVLAGENLVAISDGTRLGTLNDGNGVRSLRGANDFQIVLADGTSMDFDLSGRLTDGTPLSVLNRGTGVPAGKIKITNRAGQSAEVDLSAAQSVGDVRTAVQGAGLNVAVTFNGSKLLITDSSTPANGSNNENRLKIEEVAGGTTAAALGLTVAASGNTITGATIFFVETVGDVRRIINAHSNNGGKLSAEISSDGLGLSLIDHTAGAGSLTVTALNGSHAADDLGITGVAVGNTLTSRRLLAGLDTVFLSSLRGGTGVEAGEIRIINRAGSSATLNLSVAHSLAEVLEAINASGLGVSAEVSANGLGITIRDESGGSGSLVISDLSGNLAEKLGIAIDSPADGVSSGNLQKQYISTATRLADLNNGRGVPRGRFRITDSSGASAVVDLTQGNEETIQDVLNEINSRGIGVVARINDTGDGLLIEDTAAGGGRLKIGEEGGGTTAKSLRILQEAAEGQNFIDGSFEARIQIAAGDTLNKIVEKIRASGAAVTAAVINSGSASLPYRLSLTSTQSGRVGELAIETGASGLSFETLSQASDATVVFGDAGAAAPVILRSSTNSISNAVSGVRLDLVGISDQPVTVDVTRDADAVVEDLSSLVSALNSVFTTIDTLSSFDSETEQRGILNGDSTSRRVRERLTGLLSRVFPEAGSLRQLSQVGVKIGTNASLSLDEQKLRNLLESDPAAVEAFFTTVQSGFGKVLQDELKSLTDSNNGTIALQEQAIENSEELIRDRIEQMELLLERRRERLLAQFQATEGIIASLQSQQSALSGLSLLTIR